MIVTAAIVAAVVVFLLGSLPPTPLRLSLEGVDGDLRRRTITGAYHIHTSRSDGADPKPLVAAAAARAGLSFAIFADHGDGTRAPESPAYIDGVLCIDAVEISTNGGHYVALGVDAAPYPLGGEAAAVVEDVRRLGGFGFAAHPDHPTPELAWTNWNAPIDGLEWLNADSEWRTESRLALTRAVLNYLLRPAPAIASVLDRPTQTLARWDALSRTHRVVTLAAVDAHGGARAEMSERAEPRVAVGPSYETSFRALTNRVVLDRPLSGDATEDASAVLNAIRRGSVYSVIDAVSPDVVVDLDKLRVVSPLPPGAEVKTITSDVGRRLEVQAGQSPGDPPVPWVLTNWVYSSPLPKPTPNPEAAVASAMPIAAGEWRVEKDTLSEGQLENSRSAFDLRYSLGEGPPANQFVAAAADLLETPPFQILTFNGRASRPTRVSVQLRFPPDDRRWVKSIYLDTEERAFAIPAGELVPAERSGPVMPPPERARSLLFVVDLVNAKPGDSGELTISDVRVAGR